MLSRPNFCSNRFEEREGWLSGPSRCSGDMLEIILPFIYKFTIKGMSKCEHGQKITTFCATECCVWKEAGGCGACIKKYHNHMGPTSFVKEDELVALVKKYNVNPSAKPQCRALQESIFNYFNLVKNEFASFIDSSCMDIINQIGHPFLTENHILTTYKRLKKKDYKKIQQKDFRHFYETFKRISEKELSESEKAIYSERVKQNIEFINTVERGIRSLERMVKDVSEAIAFNHDGTLAHKINELAKNIAQKVENGSNSEKHNPPRPVSHSEKEDRQKSFNEWRLDREKQKSQFEPISNQQQISMESKDEEEPSKGSPKRLKEKEREREEREREREERERKEKGREKNEERHRSRLNSLDKEFIKMNKLEKQKKEEEVVPKLKMNFEAKLSDEDLKSSPRKRIFEKKEHEINEKKQKLIDMMKQKDESNYINLKLAQKESDKMSEKSRDESGQSLDNREDKLHLFAHTILPRSESRQRIFEETEQVAQKTIIIPVESAIEQSEVKEIYSPLFKNRFRSKQLSESSESKSPRPLALEISPKKVKSSEDIMELSERQENSLALLIKSINLKSEEAIPLLEASLKYAEDNLSATEYLSYLYLEVNRPKDCLDVCNKILEKLSHSPNCTELSLNVNNNKTVALNILGRYSESIVILEECLKFHQTEKLYKNLADAYFSIGIYDKAIYNYEKAVSLSDNYDEAHYNLAVCLFMQENYYNAKFAIAKAVQHAPRNATYLELQKEIGLRIKEF